MAEEKKAEKKPGGGNKMMMIIVILLILLLVAVGGLGYYMFTNMNKPPADHNAEQVAAKEKKKKEGPPIFEKMETFVVNLSGGDGALLQVEMQAQLADEEAKKRFTDYSPAVRSALILLLSSKTSAELSSPEGKVRLKAQVKQIINQAMDTNGEEPVESVLFTSFIIQPQ